MAFKFQAQLPGADPGFLCRGGVDATGHYRCKRRYRNVVCYTLYIVASAEREPITGVWGQSPQRGPGAEPLVGGQGGEAP